LILRRGVAELDYARAVIRVHVESSAVVRLRLRVVEKEPWTVEWLERKFGPGDAFYDVGANVGVYSLIAATICPSARTVAIEPAPANYDALCRNLALNGATAAVTALPVALAEATRLAQISLADLSPGAADHGFDRQDGGAASVSVLAYSLDDLIREFDLPQPTLVKIDVDGAEDAVLAGATETLRHPGLSSLIVEVDHGKTDAVLETLRRDGLELVARWDDRNGQPLPGIWYGVFERSG
jgi:FkbM family methyltransferase